MIAAIKSMMTPTPTRATTLYVPTVVGGRNTLFKKSTCKNQAFERYLTQGQEPTLLDATRSKYIPVTYFTTSTITQLNSSPPTASSSPPTASPSPPRHHSLRVSGKADSMPYESFKLINLQKPGKNAHSLILFKSRAITTNPQNIGIFECNGQYTQSEIRIISHDDEGAVADVTHAYFSQISPKLCINYGNDTYNPGYCGIFGIIAMVFFRGVRPPTTEGERWLQKWKQLLKYMRQDIPDEPESHGCLGIALAAKVQEIIASHPSTATGHQTAEKEIMREIKRALKGVTPL